MTPLEYRTKHKRCRYCQYCETRVTPDLPCHNSMAFYRCIVKDKYINLDNPLKGIWCKIFKAEEIKS